MRQINKTTETILSASYKKWLDKIEQEGKEHDGNYRYYYDDVVMNLYKCQLGVCAYTEMHICPPALYDIQNWNKGRYKIPDGVEYTRLDHFGELEHFDHND